MLDSLYTIGASILAFLVAIGGAFFYGRSKGKDKVVREVERKEAAEVQKDAEAYRKAVEDRQRVEQEVRDTEDAKLREELKEWVDYKPGDRE